MSPSAYYVVAKGLTAKFLGVTAIQGFGIGALAFDLPAGLLLPLFNIKFEIVEYEHPTPIPIS